MGYYRMIGQYTKSPLPKNRAGDFFLKLSKEYDSLNHSVNRIKKTQQNGNYHTPRLWSKVKGINNFKVILHITESIYLYI